ncbi:MAG: hypothetical protein ABH812_02680 [bacterium]
MLSKSPILNREDTLIIFTYANVGFGHLRVTDALSNELKNNSNSIFLSGEDKIVSFFHRITSIHPILTSVFVWLQSGKQENVMTYFYRNLLFLTARKLEKKLIDEINKAKNPVKRVVIVATHFSLAHQIARIREKIEKETNIQLFLFVQVTDDSPQHMWCVFGSDLIFVPSIKTKKALLLYSVKKGASPVNIKVIPYPIGYKLATKLTEEGYKKRLNQFDPKSKELIRIAIPISGAAVGMKYFIDFVTNLPIYIDRCNFHIILKKTPYTSLFINLFRKYSFVHLYWFKKDIEVIDGYEKEYKKITFGYEVTKPSEQAFKSLIGTDRVGGSILLLTNPVGRQEYDNLNFLRRLNLIANFEDQKFLWQASINNLKLDNERGRDILKKACLWRGIRLFKDPIKSVILIEWCLKQGVFKEMGNRIIDSEKDKLKNSQVRPDGVKQFWQSVEEYLKDYKKD